MENLKQVKVIGFVTNDVKDVKGKVPDDYLSHDENMPIELIDELKLNGWSDSQGCIWWDRDFQPKPVKAKDGNVYLCLSDEDTNNPMRMYSRLTVATKLLFTETH
jgi:hypothetical protein